MRSFLMLLGIVLSVSTLIMVVALISGVNLYVANRIANLGSNVFLVLRFPIITDMDELVKAAAPEQTDHLGRLRIPARQFQARGSRRAPRQTSWAAPRPMARPSKTRRSTASPPISAT